MLERIKYNIIMNKLSREKTSSDVGGSRGRQQPSGYGENM